MIDKVMAAASLCGLILFLAVVVIFVPEIDLAIVMILVAAFASYDFYRTTFPRKRRKG